MTRFTGDSFKITPISIEGKIENKVIDEKTEAVNVYKAISEILESRKYNQKKVPGKGWVPFQNFKKRESISFENGFKTIKLPVECQ